MTGPRRNPRDTTGAKTDKLIDENRQILEGRAGTLTTITGSVPPAAPAEDIDYTTPPVSQVIEAGDISIGDVQEKEQVVRVRVNTDIDQMTFGYHNEYDFERGLYYKVPKRLADHLEEKGLLWH